jgi:putative acetyltransferase
VAVSPVTLSDRSAGWCGLGPISVLPEHQGRGVGSQLMQVALGELRESGAAGCVLVGDPRFYHRFGFRSHTALAYPDVPAEVFLVLPLGGAVPPATVAFHPGFGAQS